MEQIIKEAFREGRLDLLEHVLESQPQFQQLEYALGKDQFRCLIAEFQLCPVETHNHLELESGFLYFFVTGGLIVNTTKDRVCKDRSRKSASRKAIVSNDRRSPAHFGQKVQPGFLSCYQQFLSTEYDQIGFFYSPEQTNLVLRLDSARVSQLTDKIRAFLAEKLKILSRLEIFETLPKSAVRQMLKQFTFKKIPFNSFIYNNKTVNPSIFLLLIGEVIVEETPSAKSIIVSAPSIVSYVRQAWNQQARCSTQYAIVYSIETSSLQQIVKVYTEKQEREGSISQSILAPLKLKLNRLNQNARSANVLPYGFATHDSAVKRPDLTIKLDALQKPRSSVKRASNRGNPTSEDMQAQKKLHIKHFFSNSLSEKYDQYALKVQKVLNDSQQTPTLYQMRTLQPKMPDYNQINTKLRELRMNRIQNVRQKMAKSSISEVILSYRDSHRDELNSKQEKLIKNKIERKLELIISKKLAKESRLGLKMI